MNNTNVIFGVLLFSFIVYITTKGELPAYIGLFTAKGTSGGIGTDKSGTASLFGVPGTSTNQNSTNTGNATTNLFNSIQNIKVAPNGFNPTWADAFNNIFK